MGNLLNEWNDLGSHSVMDILPVRRDLIFVHVAYRTSKGFERDSRFLVISSSVGTVKGRGRAYWDQLVIPRNSVKLKDACP